MPKTKIEELISDCETITINNYEAGTTGSVKNYTIDVKTTYGSAKADDLVFLEKYIFDEDADIKVLSEKTGTTHEESLMLLKEARDGLIKSVSPSDEKEVDEKDNVYEKVSTAVKKHKESGAYYVYGILLSEETIKPSDRTKKARKSKPLTIAKDHLKRKLKISNFRNLKIPNIDKMETNGDVLIFG